MSALRTVAVGLRRRWGAVLAVALAAGVLAGLGSLLLPAHYRASATHQVAVTGPAGAGDPSAATDWVVAVGSTPEFRALAATRTGPAVTADEVAADVTVAAGGSGLVTVTATGTDPARVRALAAATGGALVSAVAERSAAGVASATTPLRTEMADLEPQLASGSAAAQQRYATLARTVADTASAPAPYVVPGAAPLAVGDGPSPVRNAVLAFLAAVLVAAVAIPLVRGARGRLDETDPAAWVRERLGVPAVVLAPRVGPSLVLAELYRDHLRELPSVTVVQLSRPASCALGAELAKAAELVGDRREHHDADSGVPEPADPWVRTHRLTAVDELLVRALRGTGPTVLAVQTATARRGELERTVSGLRAIGAAPVAVVVFLGRIPRDPLHDPTAGEAVPSPAG